MTSILVTGSNGQLGASLSHLSDQFSSFQFTFTNRNQLDLTDPKSIASFFKEHAFDYCINTAAYTQVDYAEKEPDKAWAVNVEGVRSLAKQCALYNTKLIHISTDYVYDDSICRPLKEDDPTRPHSIYGKTKLVGEQFAFGENPKTIVVRTSWVYATTGKNFVKTMLRLGAERDQLNVVFDQVGTPTYAIDLADAILRIIHQLENQGRLFNVWGQTFNYSNEGVTSWYDFSRAIFEIKALDCQVKPIESKDYPTPAKRPFYSVLNKSLIKRVFELEIPHWKESLKNCLSQL